MPIRFLIPRRKTLTGDDVKDVVIPATLFTFGEGTKVYNPVKRTELPAVDKAIDGSDMNAVLPAEGEYNYIYDSLDGGAL